MNKQSRLAPADASTVSPALGASAPWGRQPICPKCNRGATKPSLSERFWAKVDKRGPDECWNWRGGNCRGRGYIYCNGRREYAPRVVWLLTKGEPFPADKLACHTCDNPACVNPAHIFPGTQADNMRDMHAKGRAGPQYQRREFCPRGHPLSGDNLYVRPGDGKRACRTCKKARWDAYNPIYNAARKAAQR